MIFHIDEIHELIDMHAFKVVYFDDNGSWVCMKEQLREVHTFRQFKNEFWGKNLIFFPNHSIQYLFDWKSVWKPFAIPVYSSNASRIRRKITTSYPCESISMLSIHYRLVYLNVNSCVYLYVFLYGCCCIHSLLKFIFQISLSSIVRFRWICWNCFDFLFLFVTFSLTEIVTQED